MGWGQACVQNKLSKTLTFTTSVRRPKLAVGLLDSCLITIIAADKQHRQSPQVIHFVSGQLYEGVYHNCNAVRSYITGKNRSASVVDNDYGDLVVADFNFDGRTDFAAKIDVGGNGGPLYCFYLQKPSGQFEANTFLTEEMTFFPKRFNARRHTLTTLVHASAFALCESTYQVNAQTGKWRKIGRCFVPYPSASR